LKFPHFAINFNLIHLKETDMLKGISPLLSPELLAALCRMGHGDEIILADAHFPGETFNDTVLRADGIRIPDLLDGIMAVFELDQYVETPVAMMAAVPGDTLDPAVEESYRAAMQPHLDGPIEIERVERFAFYERARGAFAVVMTGETAKYGNVILKKGVIPC
jgi:L-fucose mutarotase